jgi:hypothetical protein
MRSKFQRLSLAVVAVFGLGLAGCSDYSSPQGVLGTALGALKKENVKAFKRTLTGAAAEKFGNLQGMAALSSEIQGLELSYGPMTIVESRQDRFGRDTFRLYSVRLLARDLATQASGLRDGEVSTGTFRTFKDATVACEIRFVRYYDDPMCDGPGPIGGCFRRIPSTWTERQVSCRIADLVAPVAE